MVSQERKEYLREWARNNREKCRAKSKLYKSQNKDKIAEYNKTYREEHKDELKIKKTEYYKTEEGEKSRTICRWRYMGVINEDFDKLYDLYINTDKCMYCEKSFADSYYRCLDHDHKTGLYRAVLCRSCNTKDILNPKL